MTLNVGDNNASKRMDFVAACSAKDDVAVMDDALSASACHPVVNHRTCAKLQQPLLR